MVTHRRTTSSEWIGSETSTCRCSHSLLCRMVSARSNSVAADLQVPIFTARDEGNGTSYQPSRARCVGVMVQGCTAIQPWSRATPMHLGALCRFFYTSSACIYPGGKQLNTTVEGGGLRESDAWPAQVGRSILSLFGHDA